MAQLAENNMSSNAPIANPHVESAGPPAGVDIVQVLWRWKWLPLLGSIIGAGLGYLYFTKQPELFEAEALVQVIDSLPATSRMDVYEPSNDFDRADESLIIRSKRVLRMAVANGRLTEQDAFNGLAGEDIVSQLVSTEDLVVEPAAKDAKTTLIRIAYICDDRDLAAVVVNAIVEGYSEYLSEEYQSIGNEIYDVVTDAQESLQREYEELTKEMMAYREKSDVIWTQDGAEDPYAENYAIINAELLQNQLRQKKLSGTLQHVSSAMDAGRSPETMLLMLSTYDDATILDYQSIQSERVVPEDPDVGLRLDTRSKQMEHGELASLEMRERELVQTVGEGHPTLTAIRQKIAFTKDRIERLREDERKMADELERLKEAALGSQVSQEGLTVDQRLQFRREAMIEELQSIQLQEEELKLIAEEYRKKSKELQASLSQSVVFTARLTSIQKLLDAYTDKLNAIELLPQTGQRTLKELNLPDVGGFYGPKILPYVIGGAAIGFLLLSGLAVLMDLADRSYRNPEEIANDLGVSVLGHVPVMDISRVKKTVQEVDGSVASIHHSKGRVSEAYRSVRTSLYFSQFGQNLKVVQITSPVPGDGKSTLASNLAVSMAQSGRRVLLIDADFRRPRLAKIFGIDGSIGMASVIAGQAEIDDAIHQGPVANLSIMPGGKRPSNPAELLSSQRFSDLVNLLREKFDFIVIDTPPLLAVSDPGAVAGVVDGVVLTMRLRRNVKPLALRAIGILEGVGAQCLGVVVNGVSSEAGYGYNYDYNDYRYAYKYGSNYRSGYGYRYGYGNYRYGYNNSYDEDLAVTSSEEQAL